MRLGFPVERLCVPGRDRKSQIAKRSGRIMNVVIGGLTRRKRPYTPPMIG